MKKQIALLDNYKLFYEQIPRSAQPTGTATTTPKKRQPRALKRPVKQPRNILDNLK